MVLTKDLKDLANLLRIDALKMTSLAGSGHPTSCLSCADILSVLFFHEMSYDPSNGKNPNNDEFILSKGHAAPIYYASLYRSGCIKENLLKYRNFSSSLEGHPVPSKSNKWIKVATGSLGQGLSIGLGVAMAAKIQKRKYRTFVLLGDSEISEGEIYEALQLASYYKLNNLCAIIDLNRLGQRGETMLGWNAEKYKKRIESFGWQVEIIDGHNIQEIITALKKSKLVKKPFAIIAKTIKGKGVSFLENKEGWHGRTLNKEELKKALKEILISSQPKFNIEKPEYRKLISSNIKIPLITNYAENISISTRESYGNALANLVKINPSIIITDAEVSNSTFAEKAKKIRPKQFIESFITEQNMISMSLGLSIKGINVFASTFSSFLSRAHDQIRMAALSKASFTISGSHSGVSIGQDGSSQMGLDDISMFRDIPNSIIFYPSDAVSAEKLVYLSAKLISLPSIKYIRTTRPKTLIIYNQSESFKLGEFKVLKKSLEDKIVLIGSGITLHESLKAYENIKSKGIKSSVIDLYCIKPLNIKKLSSFIKSHGSKLIITEDHYSEGGIGEMLSSALASSKILIKSLSVKEIPHSGKPDELLAKYRIDSNAITSEALKLLKNN